jgi:thiol:disulfide interchange protein DsbD
MLVLALVVLLSMCFWVMRRATFKLAPIAGIAVTIGAGIYAVAEPKMSYGQIFWRGYSDKAFASVRANGQAAFLNFTASWCLNCKFNQRVFEDREVINAFRANNIVAIECDWTRRSEKIAKLLEKHGSVSIPLYIFYPPGKANYITLPTALSKADLLRAINGEK